MFGIHNIDNVCKNSVLGQSAKYQTLIHAKHCYLKVSIMSDCVE